MGKSLFLLIIAVISFDMQETASAQAMDDKPKVYAVANAHLDTQWNWDVQTTIKEYIWNTLNQNLLLLKRYPDFIFNFEGGVKYAWMKEYYPLEYAEMKKYIKAGRWHVAGGSWDANDVLIPSPESVIRNILLGQEFYRKEFQVESTDVFLPDCFGFGWTLPAIASHCGLIGFSSQKLDWRWRAFYGNKKLPFTIGLWTGVDGSSIMMAHGYAYTKRWENVDLSVDKELLDLSTRTSLRTVYRYYGSTGDRGGSPTFSSVRAVEKGIKGDGPLQIISAASDRLFKDYLPYKDHPELPIFNGELLMDVHGTGCYTSQAAMKLYNRQNELLGDAAERSAVCADWLNKLSYPGMKLTDNWKRFIFHQFHDDLTGTSIPRAYEFSWNDELISLCQFSDVLSSSVRGVAGELNTFVKGIPVVVYNALGFEANNIIEVEVAMSGVSKGISVFDVSGKKVASQLLSYQDGKAFLLMEATVPAVGYAVYDVRSSADEMVALSELVRQGDKYHFESSVYRMTLDTNGDIVSLVDKCCNKEIVEPGKAIRLALFTENKSDEWPAWEIHKRTIDMEPVSIGGGQAEMSLVESGALRKTLRVKKQYGKSVFCQYISLYEGSLAYRIDIHNKIDWKTKNALLKAEFPLNVENEKVTYDLGLGSIMRGNNTKTAYEVYAHYWADLTDRDNSYGVSIFNDSKYGWDKPDDHTLRMTLLHTPSAVGKHVYQGYQDFGYHDFTYSLMGHSGGLNKIQTVRQAELFNQQFKVYQTSKHKGLLGKNFSMLRSNNRNVLIKGLKKAENSDEYVVRVYEIGGEKDQYAILTFAGEIKDACEADGTEKKIGEAAFDGKELRVVIKPYSIKTFKVKLQSSTSQGSNLKAKYLSLNYNRKCTSWNEFRKEGNFESGYSYAAELLPDTLVVNQIPFCLGEKDRDNGKACEGDTLQLPLDKAYNRIYFLAASTDADYTANFICGEKQQTVDIPCYTGFIGQWGHLNHTRGYLKSVEIAYVGTHRHAPDEDCPYEFTYMFKVGLDIPQGATTVILPKNDKIILFAATIVQEDMPSVQISSQLFRTAIKKQGKTVN